MVWLTDTIWEPDPAWAQQEPPDYDDWDGEPNETEPIPDDVMAEDYDRAVNELQGLYPEPDDHDQRYDSLYSDRTEVSDHDLELAQ